MGAGFREKLVDNDVRLSASMNLRLDVEDVEWKENFFFFFSVFFYALIGDRINTSLGDLKSSVVKEAKIYFLIFFQSLLN